MRALGIVAVDPVGDRFTGMAEVYEQGLVQELVAHPAVERLTIAVLHGLARGDVMPVHLHLLGPGQDGVRGELGPIIADDDPRLAMKRDEDGQFSRHPRPGVSESLCI